MTPTNKYYVIPIGHLKNPILGDVVQNLNKVRKNIAGTHCVVKTPYTFNDIPASLSAFTQYDYSGIMAIMNGPDWSVENAT